MDDWQKQKEKIQSTWDKLTSGELDDRKNDLHRLALLIQQKYGTSLERAKTKLVEVLTHPGHTPKGPTGFQGGGGGEKTTTGPTHTIPSPAEDGFEHGQDQRLNLGTGTPCTETIQKMPREISGMGPLKIRPVEDPDECDPKGPH